VYITGLKPGDMQATLQIPEVNIYTARLKTKFNTNVHLIISIIQQFSSANR
jgi:hypothetical protein